MELRQRQFAALISLTLRRDSQHALLGYGNVEKRREQVRILYGIELDQRESVLQVCKPLLRRYVTAAEALAAPLGDRMERRICRSWEQLPLHPGVRCLA
jgi:hypothetical protein